MWKKFYQMERNTQENGRMDFLMAMEPIIILMVLFSKCVDVWALTTRFCLFTTTLHFFFREPLKMAKKMEKGY
jgi:hypothetical protein